MRDFLKHFCNILFLVSLSYSVVGQDVFISENGGEMEDLIPKWYILYKMAINNEGNTSLRRFFKNNKEYVVHVQKLKEVNGNKIHNLAAKEKLSNKKLIYINNPVESKIPTAFLTIDEFKSVLLSRIQDQREQFQKVKATTNKVHKIIHNRGKLFKRVKIGNNMKKFIRNGSFIKMPNVTIFNDDYVNITVEVKKASNISIQNLNIHNNIEKIAERSRNITQSNTITEFSTGSNIQIDRTSKFTDITITTQVTDSKSINTNISTDASIIIGTITQTELSNAINTKTEANIEETTLRLDETTMQADTDEHASTESTNTGGEETITVYTEPLTVTTTKLTKKTLGRPYVFLGGDIG